MSASSKVPFSALPNLDLLDRQILVNLSSGVMARVSKSKSFVHRPGGYVLRMIPIKEESIVLCFFGFLVVNSFSVSHYDLFHLKDYPKSCCQMNLLLALNPVRYRIVMLIAITVLV